MIQELPLSDPPGLGIYDGPSLYAASTVVERSCRVLIKNSLARVEEGMFWDARGGISPRGTA